ncbi:DUF4232 domain-containing protein [Streptacidiphilus neutrinimicus]|uniref:DUF4232 domain-containing protein n=1 Tax=Streptacidiphilus neutrinimicus TaxID=105420 RepID=UPI0005A9AF65|nr:DUF4232 domain-containing protein [Streptacidiphilus neutrinimicus]
MRVHKLTLAALAVLAGVSLTACQSGGAANTGQSQPSSVASGSTASSPAGGSTTGASGQNGGTATGGQGTGGQTTAAGTTAAGTTKAAECRTEALGITAVDRTITGDTGGTVVVELKNRSGRACTIGGYAGVDLQTSAGALSAQRSGEPVVRAVLKSGASTYFGISYPTNTSGGSGVRITGLVVTPPDEPHSVTLRWPGAGSLPVTDGSGTPVKVGPIGSAGQGD